jgi:AcrR family transcriptional regulator
MAQQTNENNALIEALFDIFRTNGYEGTTISLLSEVTGLQKSSLYHHFPKGKEDMLKAVVGFVSTQIHQHVIRPLLDKQVSPQKRFSDLIATIKAFYCDGKKNCLLNVLNLGETKTEINKLQGSDYAAWLDALTQLGKEAGLNQSESENWAERFIAIVEGALVIQRLTGDKQTLDKHMQYEQKQFQQFMNS